MRKTELKEFALPLDANGLLTDESVDTSKPRVNCEFETQYCFTDGDCQRRCNANVAGLGARCITGICKNELLIEQLPENNCDPRKGFVAYLVGNPALGQVSFICKTVDPGIAISVDGINRMCAGSIEPIDINYLKEFPYEKQCTKEICPFPCLIPATSVKRSHIECNETFSLLITKGYDTEIGQETLPIPFYNTVVSK